ncbi:hypothetical protein EVAR_75121_1 [Eumeta japonica]|uniref:Uncharacterized protein n=1 Tax=Eumeta variegata TaxID=151549 RepID=A0A4C1U0T9_EUMVA|nr:hypothetical protein EVAR_75121_1 [Eumeta japonica]
MARERSASKRTIASFFNTGFVATLALENCPTVKNVNANEPSSSLGGRRRRPGRGARVRARRSAGRAFSLHVRLAADLVLVDTLALH